MDLAPFCPREDCRIVYLGGSSTCMGWERVYDKHGKSLSEDPNVITTVYRCNTCNKKWNIRDQRGEITTEMMDEGQ